MLSGIDATVNYDDQVLNAQIKPYQNILITDSHISIQGSSSTKEYNNLDIMIFVNVKSKTVKIFKTKGIRIDKGNFVIPRENEIMSIVGKGDLELIDCNKYLSENIIWE